MHVLITAAEIAERVRTLAAQVTEVYRGRPLTVLGVLHGSVVLVADLMRGIATPHQIGFVTASSYAGATTTAGPLKTSLDLLPPIAGRDVLVVDDILDTGRTLTTLCEQIRQQQPASVRTAVLLWKEGRQEVDLIPDFYAFRIPDVFVVGYGLDYNGDYRHLPDLAVLEDEDLAPTSR